MHRTVSHPLTLVGLLAGAAFLAGAAGCDKEDPYAYVPPDTDPVTVTDEPPPAISGGTLLAARDGVTVVAADPDRHGIWVVRLDGGAPVFLPVEHLDEPGRVVEDAAGRAHVALRRGGAVVTVDLASRQIVDRRDICRAPRGIAYDAARDALHVACAGGELVSLPAAGGPPTRAVRLDADLRDVVVDGDRLLVSRFRSAETLVVSADGAVLSRRELPLFHADSGTGSMYQSNVAWRMAPLPGGGAAMVHQRAMTTPVVLAPGGYYSNAGCTGAIVHSAISLIDPAGAEETDQLPPATAAIPTVALPVDLAVSPSGERVAVVSAANNTVIIEDTDVIWSESGIGNCFPSIIAEGISGQPIAVAFAGEQIIIQTREPAGLQVLGDRMISFPGDSVRDTGHEMFHRSPNQFTPISCASCHPEGLDDGHTWNFDPTGARRTQTLGGGILDTAPLHWAGDLDDLSSLMDEVFVNRMSGMPQGARRVRLMARFIDDLPAFPASPAADPAAAARGQALFTDAKVGCTDCHTGPKLTTTENKDIGRGEALQVPSLIGIVGRAPYMHDGCAPTLRDRFDPACGGDKHGDISGLTEAQIDDLVAYLETL